MSWLFANAARLTPVSVTLMWGGFYMTPLVSAGFPVWLILSLLALDAFASVLHMLAHSWGAAKWGVGADGIHFSMVMSQIKLRGFSELRDGTQTRILRHGPVALLLMGVVASSLLLLVARTEAPLYWRALMSSAGQGEALGRFSLPGVLVCAAYVGFFRCFLACLPVAGLDGERLLFLRLKASGWGGTLAGLRMVGAQKWLVRVSTWSFLVLLLADIVLAPLSLHKLLYWELASVAVALWLNLLANLGNAVRGGHLWLGGDVLL